MEAVDLGDGVSCALGSGSLAMCGSGIRCLVLFFVFFWAETMNLLGTGPAVMQQHSEERIRGYILC